MSQAKSWVFPVPLGRKAHQQAKQFSSYQKNSQKAEQIYRNTLAVLAVNFFLKCMEIESDLLASDSWDIVMQTLLDVADLEIPNYGKLECRPVLPEADFVHIPLDVQADRIGYVAVRLDQSLRRGTLLGFTKTAPTEEILLSQLKSVNDLLEHLNQMEGLASSP